MNYHFALNETSLVTYDSRTEMKEKTKNSFNIFKYFLSASVYPEYFLFLVLSHCCRVVVSLHSSCTEYFFNQFRW